jgi:anti-anti-sigma factor
MDSTGLRLLLETDAQVRAAGGRCVIVRGTGAVHRVIAQGMLESRLEVVEGLSDVT